MEKLILIIGGNLGDKAALIEKAKEKLVKKIGDLLVSSSIFETEAWGGKSSGNYLNQILVFQSDQKPEKILKHIWQIEKECGRERNEKWGDRTMDIDILYYGRKIISDIDLTIPHAYIEERKFVLVPLVEIMPEFIHPILGKTQIELLKTCTDISKVKKYQKSPAS